MWTFPRTPHARTGSGGLRTTVGSRIATWVGFRCRVPGYYRNAVCLRVLYLPPTVVRCTATDAPLHTSKSRHTCRRPCPPACAAHAPPLPHLLHRYATTTHGRDLRCRARHWTFLYRLVSPALTARGSVITSPTAHAARLLHCYLPTTLPRCPRARAVPHAPAAAAPRASLTSRHRACLRGAATTPSAIKRYQLPHAPPLPYPCHFYPTLPRNPTHPPHTPPIPHPTRFTHSYCAYHYLPDVFRLPVPVPYTFCSEVWARAFVVGLLIPRCTRTHTFSFVGMTGGGEVTHGVWDRPGPWQNVSNLCGVRAVGGVPSPFTWWEGL